MSRTILDDHLLRDLLADDPAPGLLEILPDDEPATTNHYLWRLCRSVVSATGGDDGPGIRAAMRALHKPYRTIDR